MEIATGQKRLRVSEHFNLFTLLTKGPLGLWCLCCHRRKCRVTPHLDLSPLPSAPRQQAPLQPHSETVGHGGSKPWFWEEAGTLLRMEAPASPRAQAPVLQPHHIPACSSGQAMKSPHWSGSLAAQDQVSCWMAGLFSIRDQVQGLLANHNVCIHLLL